MYDLHYYFDSSNVHRSFYPFEINFAFQENLVRQISGRETELVDYTREILDIIKSSSTDVKVFFNRFITLDGSVAEPFDFGAVLAPKRQQIGCQIGIKIRQT